MLKQLNVHESKVIGIGYSGNDIPLLELMRLKVAMGNTSDNLKAIADYIAPSVVEDGLTHVIEKYIIKICLLIIIFLC